MKKSKEQILYFNLFLHIHMVKLVKWYLVYIRYWVPDFINSYYKVINK